MNPFVYGERVSGENFCNREREIRELASEINSSQNIMIYSPRRYGKTSLIDAVLEKVESNGILTIYIDLFPVISNEDFVRISLKAISRLLNGSSRNTLKKIKTFFTRISPSLSMTMDESGTPSIGINFSKTEILPAVEDIFNGLYHYIKSNNKRAVVVLDEFQQLGELEDTRIEKTLRSIIQGHREISYVFMGSKKHLIYDMFNNPGRPFFKSSAHFPLERIGKQEFVEFIKRKFHQSNRGIEEEAAILIPETAESHPYYTQMLAHTIWEFQEKSSVITIAHVKAAIKKILDREQAAFTNLWDNLTLKQKRLLLALAIKKPGDKLFSSEFLGTHGLNSSGTVQRGIKSLIHKGIIDKENEKIEVSDIFLKLWLIKRVAVPAP
ncbi:MAG: ATP-binding protein [bacterium]|nr:ATP-binding protein [bacterium]